MKRMTLKHACWKLKKKVLNEYIFVKLNCKKKRKRYQFIVKYWRKKITSTENYEVCYKRGLHDKCLRIDGTTDAKPMFDATFQAIPVKTSEIFIA